MPGIRWRNAWSSAHPHPDCAADLPRGPYLASGSGRTWNFTTLLVVPLPPSM
jgi:hypothetical protein